MEVIAETKGEKKEHGGLFILVALFLLIGGIAAALFLNDMSRIWKCDDAIKATLKAPSTYKRIDYSSYSVDGDTMFEISYDAQNSYGVPLRDGGHCTVHRHGTVEWSPAFHRD